MPLSIRISINLSYSRQTSREYKSSERTDWKSRGKRREEWQVSSYAWIIYALTTRLWSNLRYCNCTCATISAVNSWAVDPFAKARMSTFNESVYLTRVLIFVLVLRYLPPRCAWHSRPYDSLFVCFYALCKRGYIRIFPGIYQQLTKILSMCTGDAFLVSLLHDWL